jgi:hypothetical protein
LQRRSALCMTLPPNTACRPFALHFYIDAPT